MLAALIGGLSFTISPIAGQITPGADMEFDAGLDADGKQFWEDSIVGNPSGLGLLLDDTPAVTRVTVTGSSTQFTHAYDFPGGSTGKEAGALLVDAGTTTKRSFQNASTPSDWSTKDLTMEIWFKPDNINPTPSNGQILFEDGGGSGLGLFIRNNEILTSQDGGEAQIAYNLGTDTSGLLLGGATSEFIQVVLTRVASGATELFINGQSVGTSSDNDGDWSGGDSAAFGTLGGNNAGGYGLILIHKFRQGRRCHGGG